MTLVKTEVHFDQITDLKSAYWHIRIDNSSQDNEMMINRTNQNSLEVHPTPSSNSSHDSQCQKRSLTTLYICAASILHLSISQHNIKLFFEQDYQELCAH